MAVGNPVNIAGSVPACRGILQRTRVGSPTLPPGFYSFNHKLVFLVIFLKGKFPSLLLITCGLGRSHPASAWNNLPPFSASPVTRTWATRTGRGSGTILPTPFLKTCLDIQRGELPLHPRCSKGWAKARQAEDPPSSKPSKLLIKNLPNLDICRIGGVGKLHHRRSVRKNSEHKGRTWVAYGNGKRSRSDSWTRASGTALVKLLKKLMPIFHLCSIFPYNKMVQIPLTQHSRLLNICWQVEWSKSNQGLLKGWFGLEA